MKTEEINIAINDICGPEVSAILIAKNIKLKGDDQFPGICSDKGWMPDYLNDLNACHEMEKVLMPHEFERYLSELTYLRHLGRCATALERCEYFLRTIGKWKDEE